MFPLERVSALIVPFTQKNILTPEVLLAWNAYVAGNNQPLEHVYRAYYGLLVANAFYYLKDEMNSQDVVADFFQKLLLFSAADRKAKLGDVNENLTAFLKVVIKNKCLDLIKVENNRREIRTSIFSLVNRFTSNTNFVAEQFSQMIDVLPDQQKKVLQLHLAGYSNEEISIELEISYNTCRNTLSTSKKKIRVLWSTFMD